MPDASGAEGAIATMNSHERRARLRILAQVRPDSDWTSYGFDIAGRDAWIAAGIPADRAQFGAILRDADGIPGIRFLPETLHQYAIGGKSIVERLEHGKNIVTIQATLAKRFGVQLDLDGELLDVMGRSTERRAYKLWTADEQPTVINPRQLPGLLRLAAVNAATAVSMEVSAIQKLERDARVYLATGHVGTLLARCARLHGIYRDDHPLLLEFAQGVPCLSDRQQRLVVAAEVLQTATTAQRSFYGDQRISELVHAAAADRTVDGVPLTPSELPYLDGAVYLTETSQHGGILLAWSSSNREIKIMGLMISDHPENSPREYCAAVGNPVTATLLLNEDGEDRGPTVVIPVGPGLPVVALLLSFVRLLKQNLVSAQASRGSAPLEGPLNKVGRDDEVMLLYPGWSSTGEKIGEVSSADHRWMVRGHWRRQWYPSLRVHKPVWISEHESGPDGKPLRLNDRVLIVRGSTNRRY